MKSRGIRFIRCLAALLRFGPYDLDVGGAMGGGGIVPLPPYLRCRPPTRAVVFSVANASEDILAVVAALNLRLAEAELAAASAKLEATRAVAACGEQGLCAARQIVCNSAKLSGPARANVEVKRPDSGPVLAFYPAAEQADTIKTAEETKKVLKSAMDPTTLQVQVSKVRKVGRAGVVVQTTLAKAAEKIKKAAPPTLRVTEPRSRRPLVALRNLSGDPSGETVMTSLFEQNLRVKHPEWPLERLIKNCRVAFKKSRRERATTTVVLECEPDLRDVLVSLDRAYIGWEAVTVCDYIDVTCCRKCQQYGHPEAHCRSGETVCARCRSTGHRTADYKAETTKCATCHRFGRREADTHTTAARECPACRFAEERLITVTRYG
ncbi:hypothetical protein EVAR_32424_1 [Eumeta japonica]|uniref:Nucleic-acid-binding protein from transposon X-element n=1 Tax=Eumeta variegata TaxID=151549 RepID=A0A4C1VM65_EUMVA|nr:hypothetical protein EVAR_32424_1 [Eumeta japonica]